MQPGVPGCSIRYGNPGTYLDASRNGVDVEVQLDTSRLVVEPRCWTLCYRYANPALHRVRVRDTRRVRVKKTY